MNCRCVLFLAVLTAPLAAQAQITPQDTVVPNQFEFNSVEYVVSEDATNAWITVRFFPGNRSFSGSVNFKTQDGTAIAEADYTPVGGTLNFSGSAERSFAVPIRRDAVSEGEETIYLVLSPSASDANAMITRSNAVLKISNVPFSPGLSICAGANGWVTVSWLDDGTNPTLEKSSASGGMAWSAVAAVRTCENGRCSVSVACDGSNVFYRIRKAE